MLIIAIIIYVIFGIIAGPLWPLEMIGGKAGPIGVILVIVWGILFLAGISS